MLQPNQFLSYRFRLLSIYMRVISAIAEMFVPPGPGPMDEQIIFP